MNDQNNRTAKWINKTLDELSELENDQGKNILQACGRKCCQASKLYAAALKTRETFSTDCDSDILFHDFKKHHYNTEHLQKKDQQITLVFEACTCPMVKDGVTNSFLCNCTLGFSKNIFETLFKKKVHVSLEKSILKGDEICKQIITIL